MQQAIRDKAHTRLFERRRRLRRLLVLVVGVCFVVHGGRAAERGSGDAVKLPAQVAELRELLLAAVQSGDLNDLKAALEHSPVKPDLGADNNDEPIDVLRRASSDGAGMETLAALGEILRLAPAALPLGKDLENNLIFVWPYLAERSIDQLSPRERVELLSLVSTAKASEMREKKRWTWWRLAIGADGSWLTFKKDER
ncbi:MAG: hypothetical protein ACT4OU_05410 [Hyphomicrobium sp.]